MSNTQANAELLGLPLDDALAILDSRGMPKPAILRTAAPDFFARRNPKPRPDVRVVRVRPGELTVAAFRAPAWEEEQEASAETPVDAAVPD